MEEIVKHWTPWVERQEERLRQLYPGEDWWPLVARVFDKAIVDYMAEPRWGFPSHFKGILWAQMRGQLRKWRRWQTLRLPHKDDQLQNPLRNVIANEVREALVVLNDEERLVIHALYWEDMLVREVGEMIGKPRESTRQIKLRALKKLQEYYDVDSYI